MTQLEETAADVAVERLAIDGGEPVRTEGWPTYDAGDTFICGRDEAAGIDVVRSRDYFRYDQRPAEKTANGRFEAALTDYFGVRHALTCASGTTAIALALLGLDLPSGSTVLCPAFTFAATPSAVILAGLRPVLVECDADLNLDIADLQRKITPDVSAVVVVHMRGFASDVHAIRAITDPLGIPVVEDAVPALGARLRGELLGTIGVAGAFSTQADKPINTGEGGFLVSDDNHLMGRAVVYSGAYEGRMTRHFTDGDIPEVNDLAYPLFSWRMDEIRASMAASMLDRLDERVTRHQRNYAYVAAGLADVAGLHLRRPVADGAYLGESLMFRVEDAAEASAFARALRAEGIANRNIGDGRDVNVRAFWNWRFCLPDREKARLALPNTTRYLEQAIDIPLSPNLSPADCDDVVAAVTKVAHELERGTLR